MNNLASEFGAWVKSPFKADMSAMEWFYFIGLLAVINIMWVMILRHVRGVVPV